MTTGILDESLRGILDAVSDGVYVTTAEREIVFWSKGAERITGYSSDEVLNKHCYDNILVHTDVLGKNLCFDGCPLQKLHRDRRSAGSEGGLPQAERRREGGCLCQGVGPPRSEMSDTV